MQPEREFEWTSVHPLMAEGFLAVYGPKNEGMGKSNPKAGDQPDFFTLHPNNSATYRFFRRSMFRSLSSMSVEIIEISI